MLRRGLFLLMICLMFFSCSGGKAGQNQSQKNKVVAADSTDTIRQNKIVTATVTNKDGVSLKLKFNSSEGTCEAEFNGEIIELKQQRMASGIKYSNEHYVYTEWQDEIRLYKDGKLVFSHDK